MNRPTPRPASPNLREYLFGFTMHGVKLGLENIRHILDAAGKPEECYPTIHIAGTNGKGSVAAYLDTVLRAAGYRVGRFTSPHLIDLTERFLIDGVAVADDELDESIAFFRPIADALDPPPTFFEMCTAIAFRLFARANVDAAVIEVGMGGRLDSTNVIRPIAAAITNIALEHTQYLGGTLGEIAYEKAGILKPDVRTAIGETGREALDVIKAHAREIGSPLVHINRDFTYTVAGSPWEQRLSFRGTRMAFDDVPLRLVGRHQAENAAVAAAVAEGMTEHFPQLGLRHLREGLAEARWPCRLERVLDTPPVIIDVAHNVSGAQRLAEALDECVTVLAVASDKDARGMIEGLAPIASKLILTTFPYERSLPLDQLCAAAGARPFETADGLEAAIAMGLEAAGPHCPLLITGSIFTAGEARRILIEQHGAPPRRF